MKKIIILLSISSVLIIAALLYNLNILNLKKENVETENKRLYQTQEELKKRVEVLTNDNSSLEKEISGLVTDKRVQEERITILGEMLNKVRNEFGSTETGLSSRVESLWAEKQNILEAVINKEMNFKNQISELEFKLKEMEGETRINAMLLQKREAELVKKDEKINGLEKNKLSMNEINMELAAKLKDINNRIELLEKEKEGLVNLTNRFKKDLESKDFLLNEAKKHVILLETNFDSAILNKYENQLRKEFEKEKEVWNKKDEELKNELQKQKKVIAELSEKLAKAEAEADELLKTKKNLEADNSKKDKQWEERMSNLNKEIEQTKSSINSEKFKYYYTRGLNLFQAKNHKEAAAEFEKAKELDPNNANVYYNLAAIYDVYFKDMKKSIEYYRKYLSLNPTAVDKEKIEDKIKKAEKLLELGR